MKARTRLVGLLTLDILCGCWDFDAVSSLEGAPSGAISELKGDKRCIEAADNETIQLWDCAAERPQRWTAADDDSLRMHGRCLDVNNTGDGASLRLSECSGKSSQQWLLASGQLFNLAAKRCLDMPRDQSANGTPLQLWSCTGDTNQRWAAPRRELEHPFGPNTFVFDESQSMAAIQRRVTAVFGRQERNEFGWEHYALLFKPGRYALDVPVGYYTQVLGLGLLPDAVTIDGGVHADGDRTRGRISVFNTWRAAENLAVIPSSGVDRWAVGKAAPYRRMHVHGDLALDDYPGPTSGGFIADSVIDGHVLPGTQRQWISRNSRWKSWSRDCDWNMVFVGVEGAPNDHPCTTVDNTPIMREKPFLYVDEQGDWMVFVPDVRSDTVGASWAAGEPPGKHLSLAAFEIIKSDQTADDMNNALSAGKNLLITPGNYGLGGTIEVTLPNTIVLGLGVATLVAQNSAPALRIADVDGVIIGGLLVDAGGDADVLVEVGPPHSNADHSQNPTSLHDLYFRIGGRPMRGRANQTLVINSANVIADNLWLWRADRAKTYADSVGWETNTADNGLVVHGADVSIYGLFVEHYQKYQTLWHGERGRTYFYMGRTPPDVPSQSVWQNGPLEGYATYKVDELVAEHDARGLSAYCHFEHDPSVVLDRAFEAPSGAEHVKLHNMLIAAPEGKGTIRHVLNDRGDAVDDMNLLSRMP